MEHPQALRTCTLKVNIKCCTTCRLKVKEKLQKIEGVESTVYDSEGVVTVSGKIDPMIIVNKLEKWGKKAELLSLQKSPEQDVAGSSNKGIDDPDNPESQAKMKKDSCSRCDAVSDSDDDRDGNAGITRQQPDPKQNTRSQGKKKGCLGWFCKKIGGAKTKLDETKRGAATLKDGPSEWQFPKTPMPRYGGPMPYYRPFEPYPPPVIGRASAPPYQHFGLMRPPPSLPGVPPPYGFFNSRPARKYNPMVHYTSYADN